MKKTQLHLKDLTASQLGTVLAGFTPELTPLKLLKLGGEVLRVTLPLISNLIIVEALSMRFCHFPSPSYSAACSCKVRKSMTHQWKQQSAGRSMDSDLDKKMTLVKREGSAERLWKTRLLQIFATLRMCHVLYVMLLRLSL